MPSTAGAVDLLETIGLRFQALIRALPEIQGPKVHFGDQSQISEEEMPCISVELGPDVPVDPDGQSINSYTDSLQQFDFDIYERKPGTAALKSALRQRSLIHVAVMADPTLGLGFVLDTRYAGAATPALDDEGGLPGWYYRVSFIVHYRFNRGDRTTFG